MKFKNISKLLSIGILLNSFNLNSFAGVLSEDTRYETFEGSNITVPDILEEDKVDVEIEGNTLVNHVDYSDLPNDKNNNIIINQDNKEIFFENKNNNLVGDSTDSQLYFRPALKTNETYTLILDIVENTISGEQFFRILDDYGDYMSASSMIIRDNITGIVKAKFTVKENNNGLFKIYLRNPNSQENRGIIKIKNLMILEGDWTNKEIPEYFEGLNSSFEDQLVTQEMVNSGEEKAENLGKYKVQIATGGGKNLFNKNNIQEVYIDGNENVGNIADTVSGLNRSSSWIPCKPNTYYTVSGGQRNRWLLKNEKGELTYIGETIGDRTPTIRTNSDTVEFMCYVVYNDLSFLDSVQIEEGTMATPYEPYKESIKTFYLNSPLLEGDTIEVINGQATHVRRYNQIAFDGSEDEAWVSHTGTNTHHVFRHIRNDIQRAPYINVGSSLQDYIICDKFTSRMFNSDVVNFEAIRPAREYDWIMISIEKSKLSSVNANGFKEWLKLNPVTAIYKLAEPIYEPIKADLSVQLFEGTTHITSNSNISANIEITVDRVLNRAVEAIELAKINPTVENLSRARMWVNLVNESVKKDELQSEINDIADINDLQLERKSASSNLDVYIKSQNMLSMSLNTNSVTFDGYSGAEDMEILSAVNISINSSLPYSLNAYMPSEITNGDKSEIIDVDILNIKESNENIYQRFTDTTDEIVLKDSCNAGNNLIHNIDLKLASSLAHKADIYKTVIKFEAEQK